MFAPFLSYTFFNSVWGEDILQANVSDSGNTPFYRFNDIYIRVVLAFLFDLEQLSEQSLFIFLKIVLSEF